MTLIVGQKYLVATFGIVTTWHESEFMHKNEATPTTNELFYFHGKNGVYPVLTEDLKTRVKERIKAANALLKATYETVIIYEVVCDLNDDLPIDMFQNIEEARSCINGINEEFRESTGSGTKMFIRPVVVDDDSFEPVTESNMEYYLLTSKWVQDYKKERGLFKTNLKKGVIA